MSKLKKEPCVWHGMLTDIKQQIEEGLGRKFIGPLDAVSQLVEEHRQWEKLWLVELAQENKRLRAALRHVQQRGVLFERRVVDEALSGEK